MTKYEIFKGTVGLATDVCVGAAVVTAMEAVIPVAGIGLATKCMVKAGSYIISCMVADKASDYVNDQIDETLVEIQRMKRKRTIKPKKEVKAL